MQLVVKRILDKHILRLIKMWLKALIVEEREDGKSKYKGNNKGTSQGGVISPLPERTRYPLGGQEGTGEVCGAMQRR
jgi:hypothetical protein